MGDCGDLICTGRAGNGDNFNDPTCGESNSVDWFGDAGTMYRIRVHGYFNSTGDFGLTLEELETVEPVNNVCSGTDKPIPADGSVILGSTTGGTVDSVESCASESDDSPGIWYNVIGTGTFLEASTCVNETLFDTQVSVYVGDCDELKCIAGNDDGFNDPTCGTSSSVDWFADAGTMYRIRVHGVGDAAGGFGLTVKESSPSDSCLDDLEIEESDGSECECTEDTETGLQTLLCWDQDCLSCSTDETVCLLDNFGSTFDSRGFNVGDFQGFQYVRGRSEAISIFSSVDWATGDQLCNVTVDGEKCDSCEFTTCVDEFGLYLDEGIIIQCENIDGGASFNTCENTTISDGVFQPIGDDGFDSCFPYNGTFPPAPTPGAATETTDAPSVVPSASNSPSQEFAGTNSTGGPRGVVSSATSVSMLPGALLFLLTIGFRSY
jgi:hypothetical protein